MTSHFLTPPIGTGDDADYDYILYNLPRCFYNWLTGIEANTASSSSWREAMQYRTSGSSIQQATVNASDSLRWLRINPCYKENFISTFHSE